MSIKVTAILASNDDLLIGVNGGWLAWNCKEDMKFFKETTTGHVLIMGRKTISSLPNSKLPNRTIVGLTRSRQVPADSEHVVWESNPVDALARAKKLARERGCQVFIAGGAEIYNLFWRHCDNFLLTYMTRPPLDIPEEQKLYLKDTECRHWQDVLRHSQIKQVLTHDAAVFEFIPGTVSV